MGSFTARRLAPVVATGTASVACGIGLLASSGWLITRASTRPPEFVLSIAIGLVQAFALGRGVARYLARLAVHGVALDVLGRLRLRLFDVLEPLVPAGLGSKASGDVVSGFVADAELVTEGLARKLAAVVDVAASIVLGGVVACVVEPTVGAVLVAASVAVAATALAAGRLGRSGGTREAAARAELARAVVETIRCAPELVAFGRDDLVRARLDDIHRRTTGIVTRRAVGIGLGRAMVAWVAGGALVAVLAAGIAAHRAHQLSGVMLAVVAFVGLAVLDQGAALAAALADGGDGAAERLALLADVEPPVREPAVDGSGATVDAGADLDRVDVTSGATTILHAVSLHLPPGGRVALTGRSGSGKTNALYALLHFVECRRGRATVGGVDVRAMTRPALARRLAWMPETTHLFAATLGTNLRIGHPSAGDAECVDVLRRVGLSGWYGSLADGLDTLLGTGGRQVSAGERQRLGLARTLLADSPVLLLDEPTAHLEPGSTAAVLGDVLAGAGPRSVLVVSHDPDVRGLVDEVVTLEGGRVVAPQPPARGPRTR
jgi:thiol reductant ABC exporter CydC subunit